MADPKLLTEAELRRDLTDACVGLSEIERIVRKWSERGLIEPEPEPVDPLMVEAWKAVGEWAEEAFGPDSSAVAYYSSEKIKEDTNTRLALAALRRGREIGLAERPVLTREAVREAYYKAGGLEVGSFINRLHAALTERDQ